MLTRQAHITGKDYVTILSDHVHLMVQCLFPNSDAVFQDDNSFVHNTSWNIQDCFCGMKVICCISSGHHSHQISILLNLLHGLFWRKRCMIASYLYHRYLNLPLLQKKWCMIPLRNIQDMYLSIPRRLEAVLNANGYTTPY